MTRKRNVLRGAVAGAIGGLAGAWLMNQYWVAIGKLDDRLRREQPKTQQEHEPMDENATIKVAEAISQGLFHKKLPEGKKGVAGSVVHYGFGAVTGAVYGVLAELMPRASAGFGTAYAAGVWLFADELMVPALRFSKGPQAYAASKHLEGLGAHLVYGLATEGTRAALSKAA